MNKNELVHKKTNLIEELETISAASDFETSKELQSKFDRLTEEVNLVNSNLQRAEKMEALRLQKVEKAPEEIEKRKAVKNFSFQRMLQAGRAENLSGLEKEIHEEGVKEMRAYGKSPSGIAIPSFFTSLKRDLTAGTDTQGGHTVQTSVGEVIPFLHPQSKVIELGATVFDNLKDNLSFPRNDSAASSTWEGETDPNAETSPTFDNVSLTPKRVGTFMDVSKQLLRQSNASIDAWIRAELNQANGTALDVAAINGSGAGGQPTGILNTVGIGDVEGGTNGAAPTFANIVALETAVAAGNATRGTNLAYLTTPGARGQLKTTEKATNTARFIWEGTEVNGYFADVTTNVPANLTKGTGTNLHAIIFGDWTALYIGEWSGMDITLDEYTQATNGIVRVVINSYYDIAVRHAASFAAMQDALIS